MSVLFAILLPVFLGLLFLAFTDRFPTKTLLAEKIVFALLNVGFVLLTVLAFVIYTSLFSIMPWYEPDALTFLVIFFLYAPWMLALWVCQLIISKYISISRITKWLPLATTIILTALPVIDEHVGLFVQVTGTLTCVISIISTCFYANRDFLSVNKH